MSLPLFREGKIHIPEPAYHKNVNVNITTQALCQKHYKIFLKIEALTFWQKLYVSQLYPFTQLFIDL